MTWGTLAALLVGAAITLVATVVTTVGGELFRDWHGRKRRGEAEQRAIVERLLDTLALLATDFSMMHDEFEIREPGDLRSFDVLRSAVASFRANMHTVESIAARSADPRVGAVPERLFDIAERVTNGEEPMTVVGPIRERIKEVMRDLGAIWREMG